MRQCRGCGSELVKRSQKLYCSNACQATVRRDTGTQRWLETGEARIDGHRGNGRSFRRQRYADGRSY